MLNLIIKAIFFIVGKIGDIILIPIMAIINALIPNLSVSMDNIFSYLQMGFQYIPFALKCLLIPSFCVEIVIVVFTTYLSFVVGVRVYNFIMKVYKNFKP